MRFAKKSVAVLAAALAVAIVVAAQAQHGGHDHGGQHQGGHQRGGQHHDGAQAHGEQAEPLELFEQRCVNCHAGPDLAYATDRAWLEQVRGTA